MPPKRKRAKRKSKKKHVLLIAILIVIGVFFFIEESGREHRPDKKFNDFKPSKTPQSTRGKDFPKISIVMDDLGPNQKMALAVLEIDAPITLSILPQEIYTRWIATEGHRRGHDIIAHIPMEAVKPLKLGNGGLYTWMTDGELMKTLDEDIDSIPNLIGVSNHMGSALSADERAMAVVITGLKKRGLFFLDSKTTKDTVGFRLAHEAGLKTFVRDVFLDAENNPGEIENQWKRLVGIAKERGYAIALAHPRNNTIAFLQKTVKETKEVQIVPLSQLPH
jgi:polysaccharide deacetylase 2 family uncharacterized protein YibQ